MWEVGQDQIITRHFLHVVLSKHIFTLFDFHIKLAQDINTDTRILQKKRGEKGREREQERGERQREKEGQMDKERRQGEGEGETERYKRRKAERQTKKEKNRLQKQATLHLRSGIYTLQHFYTTEPL